MKTAMFRFSSLFVLLLSLSFSVQAGELAGIKVNDQITLQNGDQLILNGMGLREKLWIDVYVGSLYLPKKANNVVEVLSQPGSLRIQMNIIYTEIASKKLIKAWREGFEKNQPAETLKALQDRMEMFYSYFQQSAKKDDLYVIDYQPGIGSSISKNNELLGTIPGQDFKNALVEIWLGNSPADKNLKKGMLGLL